MKITTLLFLILSAASFGQTVWNTNAETAMFISNSNSVVNETFSSQPTCSGGQVKLYFYYKSDQASGGMYVFSGNAGGTITCGVKVWGPFASKESANTTYGAGNILVNNGLATAYSASHALVDGKFYLAEVTVNSCSATLNLHLGYSDLPQPELDENWEPTEECKGCITGFRPQAGKYIISAWVKDGNAALGTVNYTNPSINIISNSVTTNCAPSGDIIDGWQRIEKEVTIGASDDFKIDLVCGGSGAGNYCYFDDIRVFPKDGSMVTYVYDPITLRLMAELDERNYAKIYEYDEQGKLIRVKKETEMGVMIIQENRENSSKE